MSEEPQDGEREQSEDTFELIRSIKRTLHRQTWATVVLYVVMVGIAIYAYSISSGVRDSVCSLRQDLEQRILSSQQFLIDHPHGVGGIEPELIEQQIDNQQRTVTALSNISCDPAPPPATTTPPGGGRP